MSRFLLFALLAWITGSPLLALLVVVALTVGSWWAGSRYAWRLGQRIRSWGEAGRPRRILALNPHDAKARTDLGVLLVRHGRFAALPQHFHDAKLQVSEPMYPGLSHNRTIKLLR